MQDTAASLYDMSEYTLEYDLLKVNVFYNSLMEKTITDEKDYDVTVCICMLGLLKNFPFTGWQFLFGSWRKSFPLAGHFFLRPL